MFNDINKAQVMGRITHDLELKHTQNDTAVLSFSVATSHSYKSGNDWKEETTYHNVTVWAGLAERLSKKAQKGTKVFVEGRMKTRSWEGDDGKKRYKTEIVAFDVILLDKYIKETKEQDNTPEVDENGLDPLPF